MPLQLEKIFLGNTPSEQRKFLLGVLRYLHGKGFNKVVIPACGQFTIAKCAKIAGFQNEQLVTSDISLFSSLLGYLYAGKDIDEINFKVVGKYAEGYGAIDKSKQPEKVAYLLLLMKMAQLRTHIKYEKVIYDEIVENFGEHLKVVTDKMSKLREFYKGLNYNIADLRKEIERPELDDKTIVVINPPAFKGGYEKMFKFEEFIDYKCDIEEFDLAKEYNKLYDHSKTKPFPVIWYKYKEVEKFDPNEVMFAQEYFVDRYDYWLITKPDLVKDFDFKGHVNFKNKKELRKYKNSEIFGPADEITPETKVSFISVEQEIALYYRDLWCHKLGNTKAEHYFLIALDGKIFATVGFHSSELFRMDSTRVFENYGFTCPSTKYPNINRLLMLFITCKEMKKVMTGSMSNVNRVYDLRGLKTTCLSKYRKVKLNNGLMNIIKKEKLPDGMYKLMYDTDFHDYDFKGAINKFLTE